MHDNHEPCSDLPVLDMPRLEMLGDETGLGVGGVAALYLEQMDGQLGDLRAAVQARSATTVARMAHKCAGSSVLAGMERLSHLLRDLEHSPDDRLRDAAGCLASIEREFAAVMTELSALRAASGDGVTSQEP
jgi:HPt (histidine-containing phosphotransfer) domain-containing protein